MENKKNVQIEAIRIISMLMIVIFHYTYRFTELYGIETINFPFQKSLGKIGVGIFFIISGYFLARDYNKCERPINFLVKKLLRIYPMYVICVTIIYISVSIFGLPSRETSFLDYILNLLLINGFIGVDYVDGAHWFLTYMIIFYAMISITLAFKRNGNKILELYLIVNIILAVAKNYIPFVNYIYMFLRGRIFLFFIFRYIFKVFYV